MLSTDDVTALTSLATTLYAFGDAPNWRTLAAAKVFVPRISPNVVLRPRLIERLNASMSSPLTLLIAPAGFGKTTLLIQWMRQTNRSVAWLSIDEHESDVSRFAFDTMVALRQALRPKYPDFGKAPHNVSGDHRPLDWRVLASLLIQELQTIETPLTLILDDYHFVYDESINAFLALVIERLPENVNIVISSRRYPALPLSRLRARGLVQEISTDMLRFAPPEIEQFLAKTIGLTLQAYDVDQLTARTEGWVAGLQLAATALQEGATVKELFGGTLKTLDQDDALNYLCEELLARQPKEVQDFLLKTSILQRMCAELCDRITGETSADELLARLQADNLFVVPLDDEGTWFRYHHLFRLLMRNLLDRQHPEIVPELRRRAARWYAEQHLLPEAVAYAVDATDWDLVAELIGPVGVPLLFAAANRMKLWLNSLPEEAISKQPTFAIWKSWSKLFTGDVGSAERIVRDLEEREGASISLDLKLEILGIRGVAADVSDDGPRAFQIGHELLDGVADQPTAKWRGRFCVGEGLVHLGRPLEGEKWLRDSIFFSQDFGYAAIYTTLYQGACLARCLAIQGRFREALSVLDEFDEIVEKNGLLTPPPLLGYRAEILLDLNDLEGAEFCLSRTFAAVRQMGVQFRRPLYSQLMAQTRVMRGDLKTAASVLEDDIEWCKRNGNENCAKEAERLRGEVLFAMGQGPQTERRLAHLLAAGNPSKIEYVDEKEYRFFARWLIGEHDRSQDGALSTLALQVIDHLQANAQRDGRRHDSSRAYLLQALTLYKEKRLQEAVDALDAAARFALPENAVRIFVVEKKVVQAILSEAGDQIRNQPALQKVREITNGASVPEPLQSTSRPVVDLTEREQEVLNLIAIGLTNQEIADNLVVSLNTVKTHVKNVFFKLEARSRTQAVSLAREAGLV